MGATWIDAPETGSPVAFDTAIVTGLYVLHPTKGAQSAKKIKVAVRILSLW